MVKHLVMRRYYNKEDIQVARRLLDSERGVVDFEIRGNIMVILYEETQIKRFASSRVLI